MDDFRAKGIYRGVIEDNNDPLKMNRCKVRILGIHTDDLSLSVNKLPWCEQMSSTGFSGVQGIGISSVPLNGTWVWLFFENENILSPVYFGSSVGGGYKEKPLGDVGFKDPSLEYPLEDRMEETDTDVNRLSRNDLLDKTIHQKINDSINEVNKNDSISEADVSQIEPNSLSDKVVYPNCNVIETKSGHIIEIDDTPGNERIRTYHKSGSYTEIRPDGSFINKSVGTEDHYIHIGDVQKHIEKGVKEYIENNLDQIIAGGIRQSVEMDKFNHIAGYFKIQADGNLEIINDVKITGNLEVSTKITAGSDISSKSEIADGTGNLSSLRKEHDANVGVYNGHTHSVTDHATTTPPAASETPDGTARCGDFTWSSTPKGFKV